VRNLGMLFTDVDRLTHSSILNSSGCVVSARVFAVVDMLRTDSKHGLYCS